MVFFNRNKNYPFRKRYICDSIIKKFANLTHVNGVDGIKIYIFYKDLMKTEFDINLIEVRYFKTKRWDIILKNGIIRLPIMNYNKSLKEFVGFIGKMNSKILQFLILELMVN